MLDLDHPVVDTNFLITSNEVSRICSMAMERVFMRKTGVIFYGPSRLGKTQCSKILKELIRREIPKAYVSLITIVNREGQRVTNIIRQLADNEGCIRHNRDTQLDTFQKLINILEIRIKEGGCNQYVCLIDEFQRLRSADLYQLTDLYNALEAKNVKMTAISFAMPEVLMLRDELFATEQRQIISRFMSEIIEFRGLATLKDLAAILRGYDLTTEYPEGSGRSFTNAFFPQAFVAGFRLEKYANTFWSALNAQASGVYRKNLPMEHVLFSLKYLLVSNSPNDHPGLMLSERDFHTCVASSTLEEFCRTSFGK